jgi:hypothetical protein
MNMDIIDGIDVDERAVCRKYENDKLIGMIEVFNGKIIREINDEVGLQQFLKEEN